MIVIGIIFVKETCNVVFPMITVISVKHKRQDFLDQKKGKKSLSQITT